MMNDSEKQTEDTLRQVAGINADSKSGTPADSKAEQAEQGAEPPIDYRRVEHGHGPCSCCGPYSE
ncbi:hypothetical protein [Oxalicibacterium flavum]|uniref:hypothetical protein n=1 Tax=Oxalicibacterium flavum TaxID=179467 RepID=UPI0016676B41|nr:hypothetical protein [Oxalicibacterium flavum]